MSDVNFIECRAVRPYANSAGPCRQALNRVGGPCPRADEHIPSQPDAPPSRELP